MSQQILHSQNVIDTVVNEFTQYFSNIKKKRQTKRHNEKLKGLFVNTIIYLLQCNEKLNRKKNTLTSAKFCPGEF